LAGIGSHSSGRTGRQGPDGKETKESERQSQEGIGKPRKKKCRKKLRQLGPAK